jgi:hypothetical protein
MLRIAAKMAEAMRAALPAGALMFDFFEFAFSFGQPR